MRILAVALGVVGSIVAACNVWAFFIEWLTLLGILVPPIGAIILVDQYIARVNSEATSEWRVVPFIAWAAGSIVAFFVSEYAPQYSTAISAFVVAGVAYGVLQSLAAPKTQYAS
jgi:cytosine permease